MVKFKILRGIIKINNRITNLNFRRADLGLYIFSLEAAWRVEVSRRASWSSRQLHQSTRTFHSHVHEVRKHGKGLARVNMELQTGLDHEKEVGKRRKQGRALWEE